MRRISKQQNNIPTTPEWTPKWISVDSKKPRCGKYIVKILLGFDAFVTVAEYRKRKFWETNIVKGKKKQICISPDYWLLDPK